MVREMANSWQNQLEIISHNNHKNSLKNFSCRDSSHDHTKTKIKKANELNSQNDLENAYIIFKEILSENTENADALLGIALILEKQQKFDLAIKFLSKAFESNPGNTQSLLMRGRIFRLQGRYENAISDFTEIISNYPDNFEAIIARGITFGQISQFTAAINDFSLAGQVNPNCAEAFYNRGVVYEKMQQYDFAIEDYSVAIELNPHDYKAYNNRGVARRETKCFEAAIKDFDKSVKINPDFAEGYYNKSLVLLSIGNLQEGFKLYEHRWKTPHFQPQVRHFMQPLWLGNDDLAGKTILLHSEQGLGDSIQFCRYIKFFENMKCRVLLEIEKPLMTIMRCLLPRKNIFEKGSVLPAFDFHCPLMSLAHAFKVYKQSNFSFLPYLKPNFKRAQYWKKKITKQGKPLVGIVWRGNPNHPRDLTRSIQLDQIQACLDPKIDWLSLQKIPNNNEIEILNKNDIRDFSNEINDFGETSAICAALDALISVDTSAAHLSAACGFRTYILLNGTTDWRWFQDDKTTPWYQSALLFRKSINEPWKTVLMEVQKQILFHQAQNY